MTHFACADAYKDRSGIAEQLKCFNSITSNLNFPCSLANSAATLSYPETHADWVRPGIMLYGASPFSDIPASELDLHSAMTLTSKVIAVQYLHTGDKVGYGQTYRVNRHHARGHRCWRIRRWVPAACTYWHTNFS